MTSNRKFSLVLICVAVLVAIAIVRDQKGSIQIGYDQRDYRDLPDDRSEAVKKMFDGASGIQTLQVPNKVEAFRIGPPRSYGSKEQRREAYPIWSGPIAVPDTVASLLATTLLSEESYMWDHVKACDPEFAVCLVFHRGEERVDILLCFDCSVLLVARNGVVSGGENFDFAQPTLARAVKELFPSDPALQAIEEKDPAVLKEKLGL